MKVSNVSFGIRYDRNTFNVLSRAKLNGLYTEKLEENLEDLGMVAPGKVLYTESESRNPERIYSMYVANPNEKGNKWFIIPPVTANEYKCRVNQNFIDEITKNLQSLKKELLPQVYLTEKKRVEKELKSKLGEPV